jgi:hypothetical protein
MMWIFINDTARQVLYHDRIREDKIVGAGDTHAEKRNA